LQTSIKIMAIVLLFGWKSRRKFKKNRGGLNEEN